MLSVLLNPSAWSGVAQGIGLMLLLTVASGGMSALGKWLTAAYDPSQILFVRSIFSLAVVALWAGHRGWAARFATPQRLAHVMRSALHVISQLLYFGAMPYLPLAELVALSFSQPLFVAVLSAPLLRERVGLKRWLAIMAGFAATLIMLRPGLATAQVLAAGAVIFSSFLWAVSVVLTRRLSSTESSTTIVVYLLITGSVITGAASPFVWVTPSWLDWLLLAVLGIISALSQFCATEAYRRAPAAVVSPYYYATLLWTTGVGYVVWGELPDAYVAIGAVALVASGVYLAVCDRKT